VLASASRAVAHAVGTWGFGETAWAKIARRVHHFLAVIAGDFAHPTASFVQHALEPPR
jgi:hypothetical protein